MRPFTLLFLLFLLLVSYGAAAEQSHASQSEASSSKPYYQVYAVKDLNNDTLRDTGAFVRATFTPGEYKPVLINILGTISWVV
jgi:hypothetical protein